jgi:hypothetical protein
MTTTFALLVWGTLGATAAIIAACLLAAIAWFVTRRVKAPRSRFLMAAAALPLLAFVWISGVWLVQAAIDTSLLGRDPILGDLWYTPLPNGLQLHMADVIHVASVRRDDEALVSDVHALQVKEPYVAGRRFWDFFVLDTRTGRARYYADAAGFARAVKRLGITPSLQPVAEVYRARRYTVLDWLAFTLMLAGPAAGLALLIGWAGRLRAAAPDRVAA